MLESARGCRRDIVWCHRNENKQIYRTAFPRHLLEKFFRGDKAEVRCTESAGGYVSSNNTYTLRNSTALLDSKNCLQVLKSSYRFGHRTGDTGNLNVLYFSPSHTFSEIRT